MKPWRITFIFLLVAIALMIVSAWSEIRYGFSARAKPSAIETLMATAARKMAVPPVYRNLRNPLRPSPGNIEAGMEHFADHCATCHANDGSGDTMFGKGLYPKPPDLRKPGAQNMSDGEMYYTIENGVRLSGMPAFGEMGQTNDADTWKLVLFIRHLPKLSAEELTEMERLNPTTPDELQEKQEEEQFLSDEEPAKTGHKRMK